MPTTSHIRAVEQEVWDLLDTDADLDEQITYLVVAALHGETELREQLGADADVPERPDAALAAPAPPPVRAFLDTITVAGFRGIGPAATLRVPPTPGLTVVCGRNGSGKSSFAEGLEFALTGESYRFKNRAAQWRDGWRNVHAPGAPSIRTTFALEYTGTEHRSAQLTVGVDWAGDRLEDAARWSQVARATRAGVEALGWDGPLRLHRPVLSYDELGGLFESGPSALYDMLNDLLGLEEISQAERRLKALVTELGAARKAADKERLALRRHLDEVDDPRAAQVNRLTKRKPYDLDAITTVTLGSGTEQAGAVTALRRLADLAVPAPAEARRVAAELRDAIDQSVASATSSAELMLSRTNLLRDALAFHTEAGDGPCPVCATGTLDDAWHQRVTQDVTDAEVWLAATRAAAGRLDAARAAAKHLLAQLPTPVSPADTELTTLPSYLEALAHARALPETLSDLPGHVESAIVTIDSAATELRAEAATRIAALEDTWAPVAQRISAWVQQESTARGNDTRLTLADTALTWLRRNSETLRQRRLDPIADQARAIWGSLKQESNVELGTISLTGSATKRRAILQGKVDGTEVGALSVMSQGELHALALALFIPRATSPASPFRFLVLDDPIQAMDPAKIDGFLAVLADLATTRQVIVFSHDDRLPAAIRTSSTPAQLIQVERGPHSSVCLEYLDTPADLYVADANALLRDENVSAAVKSKALPGLFRMALESAAKQHFFATGARAGIPLEDSAEIWERHERTNPRLALALFDDPQRPVTAWFENAPHRRNTLYIARHVHARSGDLHVGPGDIKDLRRTVRDLLAEEHPGGRARHT
ncbi:MAG: AAA family ATPase [Gordonia sp. (in: high G+C Gram-positive bacteria)]